MPIIIARAITISGGPKLRIFYFTWTREERSKYPERTCLVSLVNLLFAIVLRRLDFLICLILLIHYSLI